MSFLPINMDLNKRTAWCLKNVSAHCMTELALGQPLAELTCSWSPYMEKTVVGHQWPKKVLNRDHSVGPTVQDPCISLGQERTNNTTLQMPKMLIPAWHGWELKVVWMSTTLSTWHFAGLKTVRIQVNKFQCQQLMVLGIQFWKKKMLNQTSSYYIQDSFQILVKPSNKG